MIDARDLFDLLNNFTPWNIGTKQNEGKRNATGLNRWRVRHEPTRVQQSLDKYGGFKCTVVSRTECLESP